jgi:hypothetical protein
MTPNAPLASHNTEADSTDTGTSLSRRALIAAGALGVVGLPATALAHTGPILMAQTNVPGQAPAPVPTEVIEGEFCNILDIPGGLKLNLLGLMVTVGPTMINCDRSGLLGDLIADLTCGDPTTQAAAMSTLIQHNAGKSGKRRKK